ncbi:hypothetical protein C2845_PM10G19280 [Panicum miliaceum]|uniref:Uncharacterized protein n=1 Tax=Panicum miliaceum TaxID=4540 RepID=A0A3L6PI30_PANMI|nr:hypothetical protein C2845_PM10G19280 [Panicum miliaceum]
MRPLPILEDDFVPLGIMARMLHAILLMCGYILIVGFIGANQILERLHIFIQM